jgi:hypothetical protein
MAWVKEEVRRQAGKAGCVIVVEDHITALEKNFNGNFELLSI